MGEPGNYYRAPIFLEKKNLKIKLRTQKNKKKKKIDSIKLGLMIFHSIKIIYNSFELNL